MGTPVTEGNGINRRIFLEYCLKHADGWVVRNLRRYGNSVMPTALISDDEDRRLGEKLLSAIIDRPVSIEKTDGGYICST